ncbi:MAG: hypothetical protein COA81_06990 [Alphaproteobacteria bacterium]|nr:MAG: hypothetical protein COA81_06990 [Alphaproteobacteria bacterium]
MNCGLGDNTINRIKAVFRRFPEISRVMLYGSRAKGNYKPGSDIDLTFFGNGLDLKSLSRIDGALDELDLPYLFDLSLYDEIENPDFLDHIKRVGILFYDSGK